jgi:hypothetical protein
MSDTTITAADREAVKAYIETLRQGIPEDAETDLTGALAVPVLAALHFAAQLREAKERLATANESEIRLQAALAERERELLDLRSHSREQSSLLAQVDETLIKVVDDTKLMLAPIGITLKLHEEAEKDYRAALIREQNRKSQEMK